ncbi:MAG: hypothetical protein A2075_19080 [Geobacteraceae bacterium GWC2_58_44]|nr:MAG: hypothetical protein A2075_19080 [Geobacteraceae bacterium GWC2_58_44]HBG07913.1 hypothetical protein [Geobacter sp.]
MFRAVQLILVLAITLASSVDAHAGAVITRMSDRQNVTLAQFNSVVERSDLILIGEAHDNKNHHDMQLSVIRSLWEKKLPLAIGLEMFDYSNQQQLDDWTDGKISEQEFQAIYTKNWSLPWSLYRDIFLFARDNHVPMVALNIPKELVTKVARQGFASLTPEEKRFLPRGTSCDLNNPHTAFLEKSFKELFKHVTNGRVFTYFCEAQTVRNSGMAMNIARYIKKQPGTKMVALAGVWHAVKNAIPEQLERQGIKQTTTVILPELPELNSKNATPDVVDYMISQ